MKPTIIFFFIFLLLVRFSYGYDCSNFQGNNYTDCIELNNNDENLIANLIYRNTSFPDYEFVRQYNDQIVVNSPPIETSIYNSGVIQNAWNSILTIHPSIKYQNKLIHTWQN
ncbi:MAG: hypothetical protein QXG00_04920 [Candidatus Woesearchaeota archaeon]